MTDQIVEKAFTQIGKEHPLSGITRSDVQQWLDLLLPLIESERHTFVVSTRDGTVRTGCDSSVAGLASTIAGYVADGYDYDDLVIEGLSS